MTEDGVKETHGVGRDGEPAVTVTEQYDYLQINLHGLARRNLSINEAKAFRRGLSRLIRRVEQRSIDALARTEGGVDGES